MSKKKKKGSSLLTILAISTALIIVGTVVTSAVMFAMQGNANLKIKNDLYYAAESGLELGQSEIVNKPAVATAIMAGVGADVSIRLLNNFDTNIEYVDVKGKKITNNKIQLTSTAKKKNSTKTYTLKGDIIKTGPGVSSLYEYSLVAKELEVILGGGATAMDFFVTKVGYESTQNFELWKKSTHPSIPNTLLTLPTVRKEGVTINIPPMTGITSVSDLTIDVGHGTTINDALNTKTETEGVKKNRLSLTRGGVAASDFLDIYIVNADKLYINNIGTYTNSTLYKSIVVCKGEIIVAQKKAEIADYRLKTGSPGVRNTLSDTSLKYDEATMISSKLSVYGSNFHSSFPLVVKDASGNFIASGILESEDQVNDLNSILETTMPGWSTAGGSLVGGGSWGKVTNIVIQ